jgi:hypothetical protein
LATGSLFITKLYELIYLASSILCCFRFAFILRGVCDSISPCGIGALTYMSIRELIEANKPHRLKLWVPSLPGAHQRVIYVETRLMDAIENPSPADHRFGALWSDLDWFSTGRRVTVGHGKETTCFMKPLDPEPDEVWEIRSKDPQPQVRIFGRFAATDCLIVTHATFRGDLGYPEKSKFEGNNWPTEIQRCQSIWNQLFQGHPPHTGKTIHDYISTNVVDVGRKP